MAIPDIVVVAKRQREGGGGSGAAYFTVTQNQPTSLPVNIDYGNQFQNSKDSSTHVTAAVVVRITDNSKLTKATKAAENVARALAQIEANWQFFHLIQL